MYSNVSLYLYFQAEVSEAHLVRLFDAVISPRCYALIVNKSWEYYNLVITVSVETCELFREIVSAFWALWRSWYTLPIKHNNRHKALKISTMEAAAKVLTFSGPNLNWASLGLIVLLGRFSARRESIRSIGLGLAFGTLRWSMHWICTKSTPYSSSQWNGCKSEKHWQSDVSSETKKM